MLRFKLLALVLFTFVLSSFGQTASKIQVAYLLDMEYADTKTISNLAENYGANAINLRVYWTYIVNKTDVNSYTFDGIIKAIKEIANNSKIEHIYLRLSFNSISRAWFNGFDSEDVYQVDSEGNIFRNPYDDHPDNNYRPMINFNGYSKTIVKNTIKYFLIELQNKLTSAEKNKIKGIVPTFSKDDETEYTGALYKDPVDTNITKLSGFSNPEIEGFKTFLTAKYGTISNLNAKWGTSLTSFGQINRGLLHSYKWGEILPKMPTFQPSDSYLYPVGRKDFMDFRQKNLKTIIDELGAIVNSYKTTIPNLKYGVQFGSVYDNLLQYRGFYDITPLVENVDFVINGDIPEYSTNFDYSADYIRSALQFWARKNGKSVDVLFGTETNWPGYKDKTGAVLTNYWDKQATMYHERGAGIISVAHWVTHENMKGTRVSITNGNTAIPGYENWQAFLKGKINIYPIKVENNNAVISSMESILYYRRSEPTTSGIDYLYQINNPTSTVGVYDFTLYHFPLVEKNRPANKVDNLRYNGTGDILTNYMLETYPDIIQSYINGGVHFTDNSYHISQKAFSNLMRQSNMNVQFTNQTWFKDGGTHGEFSTTPGVRDEYNQYQHPLLLIWLTREDLRTIYPDANIHKDGLSNQTFLEWAKNWGEGYKNTNVLDESVREYPELKIWNGKQYIYDKNIDYVRNLSVNKTLSLTTYPTSDRRVGAGTYPTQIDWAKYKGAPLYLQLKNYVNWPFIGDLPTSAPVLEKADLTENEPKTFGVTVYPNPFNPSATISFNIPFAQTVSIKVYNSIGQQVAELVNSQEFAEGNHSLTFDGSKYASGVYFCQVQIGQTTKMMKMMLLK